MKTRFVVVSENVLGYIDPRQPHVLGVLATSVIRGAVLTWQDGWTFLPSENVRPATRQDFADFRVSGDGYARRDDCDYPTA